jgi:hypothetical protein
MSYNPSFLNDPAFLEKKDENKEDISEWEYEAPDEIVLDDNGEDEIIFGEENENESELLTMSDHEKDSNEKTSKESEEECLLNDASEIIEATQVGGKEGEIIQEQSQGGR